MMPAYQIWIWRRRFISGASSPLSDHNSRINPRVKDAFMQHSIQNTTALRSAKNMMNCKRRVIAAVALATSVAVGRAVAAMFIGFLLALCPRPAGAATTIVTVGDGGFFFFPFFTSRSTSAIPSKWTWSVSGHSSTLGHSWSAKRVLADSGVLNTGRHLFAHVSCRGVVSLLSVLRMALCCGMIGSVTVAAATPTPTPTPTTVPVTVGPGGAHAFSPHRRLTSTWATRLSGLGIRTPTVLRRRSDNGERLMVCSIPSSKPTLHIFLHFHDPGTFDYFCIPHRALGMVVTVTVTGGTRTPRRLRPPYTDA